MKKTFAVPAIALAMLAGAPGAEAVDFKAKGEWIFEFSYNDGLSFARNTRATGPDGKRYSRYGNGRGGDNFTAAQRVRLQLDAVASESLSGQVFFEIGNQNWGRADQGGALGTDGIMVEVRRAFIDWIVPNTDLRVRMGLQGMALPSYTFDSGVFNDDVAGVTASYRFTDNVSLLAFWARPYNDNYINSHPGQGDSSAFMDNTDAFGVVLPLTFDGFKITPWGMVSFIGPNSLGPNNNGTAGGDQSLNVASGLTPAYWRTGNTRGYGGPARNNGEYATAWWAGLTGEVTAADPLRVAWDANYGSVSYNDTAYLNRSGWFINLLVEYKLDWGVPGIYGWYGSGDDSNPKNGSERMPVFSINNSDLGLSTFGFNGGYFAANSDGYSLGQTYAGTWGIGVRIRDISFIEDLTHTVRVNLFSGTNDPVNAKYITGKKDWGNDGRASGGVYNDFNGGPGSLSGVYLTTADYGMEVNVDSLYKIYENLDMMVELGYIHLWLDQSKGVWGSGWANGIPGGQTVRGVSVTDAVKASVFFRYSF